MILLREYTIDDVPDVNINAMFHKRWWTLNIFRLLWRHNEGDSVSNHQRLYCLLNRLFRRRWKITSKPRVTGLCAGNSPVTDEFAAQRASNAENVSIDDIIMSAWLLNTDPIVGNISF